MKEIFRSLTARAEFLLVVLAAFGYLILISVLRGFDLLAQQSLSPGGLASILVFEFVVGGTLGLFLWLRGWSLSKLGLKPTAADTGVGLILLGGVLILSYAVELATLYVSPETMAHMRDIYDRLHGAAAPVGLAVAVSIVNALYEEIFVTGYVVTALKQARSDWFAVNVSVGIRLAYHLYQGQMGVLTVLPLGLIFGFWFARTGRLWPLVVAHAAMDMLALIR